MAEQKYSLLEFDVILVIHLSTINIKGRFYFWMILTQCRGFWDSEDVIRMLIKIIKHHGLFEGHIPGRVEAAEDKEEHHGGYWQSLQNGHRDRFRQFSIGKRS